MNVGVIDIGSNSIKCLVATRGNPFKTLFESSLPTRVQSLKEPNGTSVITPHGIDQVIQAIHKLLTVMEPYRPKKIEIVATSTIRDATNRQDVQSAVQSATGYPLLILSGKQEAQDIAQGLTTDPFLKNLNTFFACDLGGGSLECIDYRDNTLHALDSFPLGAVRLCKALWPEFENPFDHTTQSKIETHIQSLLTQSKTIQLQHQHPLVFCGGGLAVALNLMEKPIHSRNHIPIKDLQNLLSDISELTLPERLALPHMPVNRADVLPVALTTVICVANQLGVNSLIYSYHNLKYGRAKSLLGL